jgi:hypothetical protein
MPKAEDITSKMRSLSVSKKKPAKKASAASQIWKYIDPALIKAKKAPHKR